MNNIFKAEFYKIQKSKSTLGLFLVLAGFSLAMLALYFILKAFFPETAAELTGHGMIFSFVDYAHSAVFQYGTLIYISGIVIHMYSCGPMKQLVATGNSRRSVIVGQYCAFGLELSVMAIICGVIDAVCANPSLSFGEADITRIIISVVGMLAVVWCLTSFCLMFTHLVGNVGAAIAIGLVLMMGGNMAVSLLAGLVKMDWIREYWLFNMFSSATDMSIGMMEQIKFIAILGVLCIVFIELAAVIFKQKEIK